MGREDREYNSIDILLVLFNTYLVLLMRPLRSCCVDEVSAQHLCAV